MRFWSLRHQSRGYCPFTSSFLHPPRSAKTVKWMLIESGRQFYEKVSDAQKRAKLLLQMLLLMILSWQSQQVAMTCWTLNQRMMKINLQYVWCVTFDLVLGVFKVKLIPFFSSPWKYLFSLLRQRIGIRRIVEMVFWLNSFAEEYRRSSKGVWFWDLISDWIMVKMHNWNNFESNEMWRIRPPFRWEIIEWISPWEETGRILVLACSLALDVPIDRSDCWNCCSSCGSIGHFY